MGTLFEAIERTPIIDHHAHNLLLSTDVDSHDLLAITSEASGTALNHGAPSTLAHLRAVKNLAQVLDCEPSWGAVQEAIREKRQEPDDAWARRCFEGIETLLIDDGLDPGNVHPYNWHSRLTQSTCKRIVRIERVAEAVMLNQFEQYCKTPGQHSSQFHDSVISQFVAAIREAISDPEVVGFKSVICYRVGLAIPEFDENVQDALASVLEGDALNKLSRLQDKRLSPFFVHLTARLIERHGSKKPFQFHTGLGDNDINLGLSSPSHLQPFIETYPGVSFVLLHASYPFTKEAGYLASVYEHCYLDIGEVFPMVSIDGQERVIRDALDLCPSRKLMWSTDGHWFPSSYLLAVMQARESMRDVLQDYIERKILTTPEAIKILEDVFFNTANQLYGLNLALRPLESSNTEVLVPREIPSSWENNLARLEHFLSKEPSIRFLRLQWLDYTTTLRVRILPVKKALSMFSKKKFVTIVSAVFGLLQEDECPPGFNKTGQYNLYPNFESLRVGSREGYATVQCEFQEENGNEVEICPRTVLRKQMEKARSHDMEFLAGFEIEVVFMSMKAVQDGFLYGNVPVTGGHAWSAARSLHSDKILDLIETILKKLERAGIEVEQFHPESCPGQFEFVLGPSTPLQAVDTLLAAREIISSTAANADMRATLFPKPYPTAAGSGAHTHLSFTPADKWEAFYAGVLKHLKAIAAFTYPNDASYKRVSNGSWAGSTYIAWGTKNRETPLRRLEGSHFEIKCMDGLANPYLSLGAIIAAGLQGVLDGEVLSIQDCLVDPADLSEDDRQNLGITEQFPTGIGEALDCLGADRELRRVLGPAVDTYVTVKRAENEMLGGMDKGKRRNWLIERY